MLINYPLVFVLEFGLMSKTLLQIGVSHKMNQPT